jgi:NTP pyrophosphatase (non-canonical NTP hydrolase)
VDANKYQGSASRTASNGADPTTLTAQMYEKAMLNWTLGIAGEAGEFADSIKKIVFHGHLADDVALAHELGDILWYVAVMASLLGYTLGEVMQMNLDKLQARYPEGFSQEASVNRTALPPIALSEALETLKKVKPMR